MKNVYIILCIILASCGSAPGVSPSSPAPASVAPEATPRQPASNGEASAPQNIPDPTVSGPEEPAQGPAQSPYPNLYCYSTGDVYCTGGAVGTALIKIDLKNMFIAGSTRQMIVGASVIYDVNATKTTLCSQPHGDGCFIHSVCIQATIRDLPTNQFVSGQLCGNTINDQNILVDE